MKGKVGMEKFLTPGAIVLAAILGLIAFRYEVQPVGSNNMGVMLRDRWSGEVSICGRSGGDTRCFPILGSSYKPIVASSR